MTYSREVYEGASDMLDECADYVVEHGWMQGGYKNSRGNVCMLGAMMEVVPSRVVITNAGSIWDCANDTLNLLTYPVTVVGYNDSPGRTLDDVVETFRIGAKNCRERAGSL